VRIILSPYVPPSRGDIDANLGSKRPPHFEMPVQVGEFGRCGSEKHDARSRQTHTRQLNRGRQATQQALFRSASLLSHRSINAYIAQRSAICVRGRDSLAIGLTLHEFVQARNKQRAQRETSHDNAYLRRDHRPRVAPPECTHDLGSAPLPWKLRRCQANRRHCASSRCSPQIERSMLTI
jgi:hypothetical protein